MTLATSPRTLMLLIAIHLGSRAEASVVMMDWSSTNGGKIGSIDVGVSGYSSTPGFRSASLVDVDFSGSNYSYAPFARPQMTVTYFSSSQLRVTFATPVSGLLLYAASWRGSEAGGPNPVTYTFNDGFSIASGLANASQAGNTLSIPNTTFGSGILKFNDPIQTLTITTSATGFNYQSVTFGRELPVASVPEPSGLVLGVSSVTLLGIGRLARRSVRRAG